MRIHTQGPQGRTLLHQAVLAGQAAAVEQLLGAAPELAVAADADGATALHLAARHPESGAASPQLVALLVNSGSARARNLVGRKDRKGRNALHYAAAAASLEALQLLLRAAPHHGLLAGAAEEPDGWLACHYAAAAGHADGVAALLRAAPATIDARLVNGRTPLHLAAYFGHASVVQVLCQLAGSDVIEYCNAADSWDNSPLHLAAWKGHAAAARALLAASPDAATTEDDQCMLPLHRAAKAGQAQAVAAMLETPAGRETAWACTPDGSTPLALAAAEGHFEAAAALLQGAPDTALIADHDGLRPFARALLAGHEDLAAWLLDPTSPLPPGVPGLRRLPSAAQHTAQRAATQPLSNGHTPLGWAAHRGDCAVAALLLDLRLAAPSQEGNQPSGRSALQLAAAAGHTAMIGLLLAAEPSAAGLQNRQGQTALHLAAEQGHLAAVRQLLAAAPDAAEVASLSGTPLLLAVRERHAEVAAQLLAARPGACFITCGPEGCTPLHQAVWLGDAELAHALLRAALAAAELQSAGQHSGTPLALAAMNGHAGLMQQLLQVAPIAAGLADSSGMLPLHRVFKNKAGPGTRAVAAALLQAAPQAAALRLPCGSTALLLAVGQPGSLQHRPGDDAELMRALLAAWPAAATEATISGSLPIHRAAMSGCLPAVQLLLAAAPATAAQRTAAGATPLSLACGASRDLGHQCAAVVAALLAAAPAAAAIADLGGCLPIHRAVDAGFAAAVPLLLAAAPGTAGAATLTGMTPLHTAVQLGHHATCLAILAAAPQVACQRSLGETALHLAIHRACSPWDKGHAAAEQLAAAMAAAAPAALFERDVFAKRTPLEHALQRQHIPLACAFVAVQLAAGQPPAQLIELIKQPRDWPWDQVVYAAREVLIADVAARVALTPHDWQRVPAPTRGLGAALRAVLRRSLAEAAALVARLPAAERQRLRCAALCLSRASRGRLPAELATSVLALAAAHPEQPLGWAAG